MKKLYINDSQTIAKLLKKGIIFNAIPQVWLPMEATDGDGNKWMNYYIGQGPVFLEAGWLFNPETNEITEKYQLKDSKVAGNSDDLKIDFSQEPLRNFAKTMIYSCKDEESIKKMSAFLDNMMQRNMNYIKDKKS